MKIISIDIFNYGPFYGAHSFSFSDRGLVLVMGDNQDEPRMDSNGSGKSSIFDALDWCLFGKVPRGDHADSVRNEESKKCEVRVHLQDDKGVGSTILRSRDKKSALVFVEGTVDRTALDTKETQRYIEQYLGLDRDVFHAAVLFGQTDLVRYAESTDAERMSILTKILQLDEIDELLDKAKIQHATIDGELVNARVNLSNLEAVLANMESVDFSVKIKDWEDARDKEIKKLYEVKGTHEAAFSGPKASTEGLSGMRDELAQLEKNLYGLMMPSNEVVNQLAIAVSIEERNKDAANLQLQKTQQAIDRYRATLNEPQQLCESCGQVVSRNHIEDKLKALEAQLVQEKTQYEMYSRNVTTRMSDLSVKQSEYQTNLAKVETTRTEYTNRIAQLKADIQTIEAQIATINQAADGIRTVTEAIEAKRLEANPFVLEEQANRHNIDNQKVLINNAINNVKISESELGYWDFWVKALGAKGLKSYILDSRLQELTDAANQWVQILTGGTIWVQFESQKQTRGKKLVNSPDIRVCRWNTDGTITERNFRSWSGGEKQRISFAIDFGLSRLIANRAKQNYDLLILDEVFKHLDRSGKEAVMEMLQVLAKEKSSVLVVEHDTEFQGSFEHRIKVQKKNRRSTIVELDNGKKESIPETTNSNLPIREPMLRKPIRTPVKGAITA